MVKSNWLKEKIIASRHYQTYADKINGLVIKQREGRLLTLVDDRQLLDFVSCSYLGLDEDKRIVEAASTTISRCGVTFPAARTRIQVESFVILEALLQEIFAQKSCVFFQNLHQGHLGVLPLLGSGEMPSFPAATNGFVFIFDQFAHSSLQINRALMAQFGEVHVGSLADHDYLHNAFQTAHQAQKTAVVICDSIGSMGGINSVSQLYQWAEEFKGYIYFDDAHGTSIIGQHGCGHVLHELQGRDTSRLILTSSLSKAFGAVGGVVAVPTAADAFMIKHYAPTYVFSGPSPLAIVDSAIAAAHIHLSDEITVLQQQLWANTAYLDTQLTVPVMNQYLQTPIRGIFIGDEHRAIDGALRLREEGIAVTTAMYPTVPKQQSLLRLAISAKHTEAQLQQVCTSINQLFSASV